LSCHEEIAPGIFLGEKFASLPWSALGLRLAQKNKNGKHGSTRISGCGVLPLPNCEKNSHLPRVESRGAKKLISFEMFKDTTARLGSGKSRRYSRGMLVANYMGEQRLLTIPS
jgi:hypothetical protein